jgi:hypothetical protein
LKKDLLLKITITIIISLIIPIQSKAQDQLDSLDYIQSSVPLSILSNKFDKQLNTFNLHSILEVSHKYDKVNLNLMENFSSTFVRSADRSNRDEHMFTISGSYIFNPVLTLGIGANNNIYSDSRSIEINQASLSNATVYGQITPLNKFTIAPYFGYENNRQIGESDNGFIYGTEALLNNLSTSNFDILSQIKFRNEDISPRKNTLRYLNFVAGNTFTSGFSNVINFQYFQSRKDFYYLADSITAKEFHITNNIQSRIESNNILLDTLNYDHFLDLFSLKMLGSVSSRTIDRNTRYRSLDIASPSIFDTKINELKFELGSVINYRSSFFEGSFRIDYSERDEKHQAKDFPGANQIFYQERADAESIKNNTSKRTLVSLFGNLNLSPTDKVQFSLLQNKLTYDTPSLLNYDDRDELLSIVRIRYTKFLSPFFSVFFNTEGTLNHIVYIFSERSSNNNINRIIRLSSGGSYYGTNISTLNSFEVSANYTVYDFEDITQNFRSFSFRQFTATDSSRIKLYRDIDFVHFGYIKLSEQGDLRWASFSTHPTRYLQEIYSEPKFVFSYNSMAYAFGLRIYSLNTYNYQGLLRVINSRYLSVAPLTKITISLNNLTFYLLGWYEFININEGSNRQQANLSMTMNWNF